MTDKTDIAALRAECAQWVKDTFGESIDTRMALNGDGNDYMQFDMAAIWKAWHHLSGKRQRAEEDKIELDALRGAVKCAGDLIAERGKELAAIKEKHIALRESMAAIHNTIRGSGVRVSLSVLLSASENAWRASAPVAKGTEKPQCDKCGGRGAYHCPQLLGTVECECGITPVFTAPQNPDVTNEMALAFHFAMVDGASADDDVEDIKIGLRAALSAYNVEGNPVVMLSSQGYVVKQIEAAATSPIKSDLLTRAEALAVETRALANIIKEGECA